MATRRSFLAGLGAAALAGCATRPAGVFRARSFAAPGLGTRTVRLWQPASWRTGGPVLYVHDGQSVFDAFRGAQGSWGYDAHLEALVQAGAVRSALIVAIDNSHRRWSEYLPEAIAARLPSDYRARVVRPEMGTLASDAYLRLLAEQVKPWVDRTCRPSVLPADCITIGASMGGLIALYAACEYPTLFGRAAAISTHWPMLWPDAQYAPTAADAATVARAWRAYFAGHLPPPAPHRFYLDHGDRGLDASYAPFQAWIAATLAARGWVAERDFTARGYPGDHLAADWRMRLGDVLRWVLAP